MEPLPRNVDSPVKSLCYPSFPSSSLFPLQNYLIIEACLIMLAKPGKAIDYLYTS